MKAVVIDEFGLPDVLQLKDLPTPEPAKDEVILQVRGAGVGPWDALIRDGKSSVARTLPMTLGSDVAGTVVSCGDPALPFKPGDEVYGVTNEHFIGGYAEYAACKASKIALKPQTLDFIQAASVPVVAVTAWQMLFDYAKIASGQRVLVHGAAGNVGAYAVQLAKDAGARVIATASADTRDFLVNLGADEIIDYHATRFEDAVSGVDAVLDTVGGETLARSFRVVRTGGTVVSSAQEPPQDEAAKVGVRAMFFFVDVTTERLNKLSAMFDAGTLRTHVGEVLDLRLARDAHDMLSGAPHHPGKIVLRVSAAAAT